ncbi:MAG: DUF1801 domain-containing protein [bacterium]
MADTALPTVDEYLATLSDPVRLADAKQLLEIMGKLTGQPPVMSYATIVGFGSYYYKYATGREGDSPKVAFSARKEHLVLYGVIFYDHGTGLLEKLGKYKQGKGCLYIKKLADVDMAVLEEMIRNAYNRPHPAEG